MLFQASERAAAEQAEELQSLGVRSDKISRLEAVLFLAEEPLSTRKLMQWALLSDTAEVSNLIEDLNVLYDREQTPFRVERVATGYQLLTRPELVNWLDRLHQRQARLKLSPPAMETLTIVAYRQPITRADIEAVRGVQCTDMLKQLMERGLIRIGGEDDSLGRPFLYVTTRKFLEHFGLRNLDDLPNAENLRVKPQQASTKAVTEPEDTDATGEESADTDEVIDAPESDTPAASTGEADDIEEAEAA